MVIPFLKDIIFSNENEPKDINNFGILLDACIGIKGSEGSEYFSFVIVTPRNLSKRLKEDKIFSMKSVFIVNEANMEDNIKLVESKINNILKGCSRDTWEETALAINCYLNWEYYDDEIGICDYYLWSRNLKKQLFYIDNKKKIDQENATDIILKKKPYLKKNRKDTKLYHISVKIYDSVILLEVCKITYNSKTGKLELYLSISPIKASYKLVIPAKAFFDISILILQNQENIIDLTQYNCINLN